MHGALADVTDATLEPDRRAWHRAHATRGPDEDVAAELEQSAGRAQARGGLAAAAAFLGQAAELTADPARRAERTLEAAQVNVQAGAFDPALGLLAAAEAGPLDELGRARMDLLRAEVAYSQDRGSDAPPLLLRAAKTLEPLDPRLARETYLDAFGAAVFAGRAGKRREPARRLAGRDGRPPCAGPSAPVRSAAGRLRAAVHRRTHRGGARARAGGDRVRRRRGLHGGGAPLGVAGDDGRSGHVGLRDLCRGRHPGGPARPRFGCAHRARGRR